MTYILKVAAFHPKPFGRLPKHDPEANGELFRNSCLLPALEAHDHVTIDFTGIDVVGASFVDEAVAGLIYHDGFRETDLKRRIAIVIPGDDAKVLTAWRYIAEAERKMRQANAAPAGVALHHA